MPVDYTPNGIPSFTLKQIRTFFAKRPFARPHDWPTIDAEGELSDYRQQILSAWIHGYRVAKD
jgi:hypothetical protein